MCRNQVVDIFWSLFNILFDFFFLSFAACFSVSGFKFLPARLRITRNIAKAKFLIWGRAIYLFLISLKKMWILPTSEQGNIRLSFYSDGSHFLEYANLIDELGIAPAMFVCVSCSLLCALNCTIFSIGSCRRIKQTLYNDRNVITHKKARSVGLLGKREKSEI